MKLQIKIKYKLDPPDTNIVKKRMKELKLTTQKIADKTYFTNAYIGKMINGEIWVSGKIINQLNEMGIDIHVPTETDKIEKDL